MNTSYLAVVLLPLIAGVARAGEMAEGSGLGASSAFPFLRNVFLLLVLGSLSLFTMTLLIGTVSHARGPQ